MREIRTSGSMSGEGKRSDAERPKPPRPSSTLLNTCCEVTSVFRYHTELTGLRRVDTEKTYPLTMYLNGVAVDDRCATGDDFGSSCNGCYEKEYRQKRNCTDHDAIVSRAY